MLKLCGYAVSNYYNKVKLALLEKCLPFEEELVWPGHADPVVSPLGKVPYLVTESGPLSESEVILEYIEATYPQPPLLPGDPYQAARARELIAFLELYLELPARELYPQAFFGGTVSDEVKTRQRALLDKTIPAFARLAKFAPYAAGATFTLADCAALCHLPLISACTKIIYGEDLLTALPVKDYLGQLSERPTVQKLAADRKAHIALMKNNSR